VTDPVRAQEPTLGQDPVLAQDAAGAKARTRGRERAPQRRGALATAVPPRGRTPRRFDDEVIARLPESGRGLQIMRAMVDDVTLQSGPGRGTVVSMRKRVSWRNDAPMAELSGSKLRDAV
jgi:hypothetical protein